MRAAPSGGRRAGLALLTGVAIALAMPATAQTQAQMTAQAGADFRRADAAMNAQWTRTLAQMKRRDAEGGAGFRYAAALLDSQRAWLAFRDRQCTIAAAEFAGGSLQPMARGQCLARLSRERTAQLKDLMWTR
jgi:uncharacterized protein YecT (DUF1311 family)